MTIRPHANATTQADGQTDTSVPRTSQSAQTSVQREKPVVTAIRATWRAEQRFDTGRVEGPTVVIDGAAGPGPVEMLLGAVATCSALDIIGIIAKRRTPVETLEVNVRGHRRSAYPRRVTRLDIEYRVGGLGIEREHAERAIRLSFERYCSVAASLAADIVVETTLVLNGDVFAAVMQQVWQGA